MTRMRFPIAVLVLLVLVAACGDDDATTTGAPVTTAAPETTAAPATTAATTTTAAPTTTTTTTTVPEDAHPVLGVSWAEIWPADGASAEYLVTSYGEADPVILPAVFEYGVEFLDRVADRLVVGTPEGGNKAMVAYFDRSEPWMFEVIGVEIYTEGFAEGPVFWESFAEPLIFDLDFDEGDTDHVDTVVALDFGLLDAWYELSAASFDATVDLPVGTIEGAVHLVVTVGGQFITGDTDDGRTVGAELWLHPEHLLLKFADAPGFQVIELASEWSE